MNDMNDMSGMDSMIVWYTNICKLHPFVLRHNCPFENWMFETCQFR